VRYSDDVGVVSEEQSSAFVQEAQIRVQVPTAEDCQRNVKNNRCRDELRGLRGGGRDMHIVYLRPSLDVCGRRERTTNPA